MSSLQTHHPEGGLLLRYIDGELPARKVRHVGRHLEACWQCRSEVEGLQGAIADCVRYRKNVLETHLQAPPSPWRDLDREFDRIDLELSEEPWLERLKRVLASPATRRWGIAMAAALVVAVVVLQQFREAPAVQAATLLKRAVAAADLHPGMERRIRIQTRSQRTTRVIGSHRTAPALDASAAALQARFLGAHYDWDDPLSARAYQTWRDGLATPHDEVTTVADRYRIRTVSTDGSLATASMMLRTTDLRPIEGRLEFRDGEWVEFTEVTESTTLEGGRPVTSYEAPRNRTPGGVGATGGMPETTASISDELQVLAALHGIGADLGDPVDVTLSAGRVVVSGVGISQQRQEDIHRALDTIPRVEIQFTEPVAAAQPPVPATSDSALVGVKPAEIQTRVERQVGGHAEFQRFSSLILDRNESMMSRAYALRTLARRFPADVEARLTLHERQILRDIAREHATALAREASGIEGTLNPILAAIGGSVASPPVEMPAAAWQPAAEGLWRASHRVEMLVSVMLGVSPGDGSGARLPSELLSALREVREDLDTYQKLLGQ